MPRPPRMLLPDRPTVYHVMSRTALPGLPFDGIDKDDFLARLKTLSQVYFTEILGFCLMDNHFHILVRMFPEEHVPDTEVRERYRLKYGDEAMFPESRMQEFRKNGPRFPSSSANSNSPFPESSTNAGNGAAISGMIGTRA